MPNIFVPKKQYEFNTGIGYLLIKTSYKYFADIITSIFSITFTTNFYRLSG